MNSFVSSAVNIGTTTRTENGDLTYSTSLNHCVDLFFQIGAIRGQGKDRTWNLFSAALADDPEVATRIALWARDIRGGAGERQVFRDILRYLELHRFDILERILHLVPEVGRWDDLFVFETTRGKNLAYGLYRSALDNRNGLAAKWAPRKGPIAKELRDACGYDSPKLFRKLLVGLTKVVETQMCAKEWEKINYEHVPSVASARYAKAFGRHDNERYVKYLESVKKGEAKINTGAVYPYDVIKQGVRDDTADTMWNNLPDYVKPGLSFLPMIDLSGSMESPINRKTGGTTCMDVAVSLGIYLAERNKSDFKDMFLSFADRAAINKIPGGTIRQKVNAVHRTHMGYSTNLDAAIRLVLEVAMRGKVPQEDMPTHLIILSDMEFNPGYSYDTSIATRAAEMYKQAGYKFPNIVWWNIQSRHGNVPVRFNQQGMALVSGFSPSIMTSMLGDGLDPVSMMMAAVGKERYNH